MIPESHPLQKMFVEMVGRHYAEEIGLRDPQIVAYVAHLLSEFCDAEQLFHRVLRGFRGATFQKPGSHCGQHGEQ